MIFDQETYELIESYLNGELKDNQLREFEHRFINDSGFAEAVKKQKQLKKDLENYGKRRDLKRMMDEFHTDIDINELRQTIFTALKRKSRVRTLLYSIPAAACVSALVVFGLLFSLGMFTTPKQVEYELLALKGDLNDLQGEVERKTKQDDEGKKENAITAPSSGSIYFGTAFPISENGYFITSKHVIKDAEWIKVESGSGDLSQYYVEVVDISHEHDLALLRITDTTFTGFGDLPFNIAKNELAMGEYVYTLGFPRKEMVFNEGSISSTSGYHGDTTDYQVSIPVNKGNSGGPLFNEEGNIIGIINARSVEERGAAYAVKTKYLHDILEKSINDTLNPNPPILPNGSNQLHWQKRPQQIEKLKPYIFRVRAYKKQSS